MTEIALPPRLGVDVGQAQSFLRAWYESRSSDSRATYATGESMFREAARLLPELIDAQRRGGYVLQLTVGAMVDIDGERALPTYSLRKGAYDFISVDERNPLRPGETLELKTHEGVNYSDTQSRVVYVGEYSRLVELGELAQALTQGSEIGVARARDIPEP